MRTLATMCPHTTRPVHGHGLCGSCYNRGITNLRTAACHPERPHYAKGVCRTCYLKRYDSRVKGLGYRLTAGQYEEMLIRQGGRCALCGDACTQRTRLSVDHNKITGNIRALLCHTCNLNRVGAHTADSAQATANYLRSHEPIEDEPYVF